MDEVDDKEREIAGAVVVYHVPPIRVEYELEEVVPDHPPDGLEPVHLVDDPQHQGWVGEQRDEGMWLVPDLHDEVLETDEHVRRDDLLQLVTGCDVKGAGIVVHPVHTSGIVGEELEVLAHLVVELQQPPPSVHAPAVGAELRRPLRHQQALVIRRGEVDPVAVEGSGVGVEAGGREEVVVSKRVGARPPPGVGQRGAHLGQAEPGHAVGDLLTLVGWIAGLEGYLLQGARAVPVGVAGLDYAERLVVALGAGHVAKGLLDVAVDEYTARVLLVHALLVGQAGGAVDDRDRAGALLPDKVAAELVRGGDVEAARAGSTHHSVRDGTGDGLEAGARDVACPAPRRGREGAVGHGHLGVVHVVAVEGVLGAARAQFHQQVSYGIGKLVRHPAERPDVQDVYVVDALQNVPNGGLKPRDHLEHRADDEEYEVLVHVLEQDTHALDEHHHRLPQGRDLQDPEDEVAELVDVDLDVGHDAFRVKDLDGDQELHEAEDDHVVVIHDLHDGVDDLAKVAQQVTQGHELYGATVLPELVVLGYDRSRRGPDTAGGGVYVLVEVVDGLDDELLVGDAVGGGVVEEGRVHALPGRHAVQLVDLLLLLLDEAAEVVHGAVQSADADGHGDEVVGNGVEHLGLAHVVPHGGVLPVLLADVAEAAVLVVVGVLGAEYPLPVPQRTVVHVGGVGSIRVRRRHLDLEEVGDPVQVGLHELVDVPALRGDLHGDSDADLVLLDALRLHVPYPPGKRGTDLGRCLAGPALAFEGVSTVELLLDPHAPGDVEVDELHALNPGSVYALQRRQVEPAASGPHRHRAGDHGQYPHVADAPRVERRPGPVPSRGGERHVDIAHLELPEPVAYVALLGRGADRELRPVP
eukprot:416878-Hanusia_phi.AAC.2